MSLSRLEEASLMIAQALVQKDSMTNMYEIAQKATEIAQEVLVQAAGAEAMPAEMDDDMFDDVDELLATDVAYGLNETTSVTSISATPMTDAAMDSMVIATSDADSSTVTVSIDDIDSLNVSELPTMSYE